MTPRRKSELADGAEVAVWLSKSTSRGSRFGADNRAAPNAGGSGCWVRAFVHRYLWRAGRERIDIQVPGGRTIRCPSLMFLQVGALDLQAPDPRQPAEGCRP